MHESRKNEKTSRFEDEKWSKERDTRLGIHHVFHLLSRLQADRFHLCFHATLDELVKETCRRRAAATSIRYTETRRGKHFG